MHSIMGITAICSTLVIGSLACSDGHPTGVPSGARDASDVAASDNRGGHAPKMTVVLVHGAFADASGWQNLIPLLQHDGFNVIAVQNTLTSLANDIVTTQRVIDAQTGPLIVVGHSYGGAVITGAAAGRSNVKSLVYVAAFAPDANEPVGAFNESKPSSLGGALRPDAAGFLYIDTEQFHDVFAADLPMSQTRIMAVTQKPLFANVFAESVPTPAWKTIPSWYVVASQDKAINPDLERFYAKRMGAKTTEVRSSHVPFISRPEQIEKVIRDAAGMR
ncbi:MAG TPA: alpha/beta hydrolase [Gemmatimonadaceae bacterium]|jgi:pimeloyl-ACP methyl ester carboxylesterase